MIVELDEAVLDAADERLAREDIRVSALRRQTRGLAQRRAQVADDIAARHAFPGLFHVVDDVVLVLEIRAVEHHQNSGTNCRARTSGAADRAISS
jgi:hypothetical protein